eukprot:gene11362-27276_t
MFMHRVLTLSAVVGVIANAEAAAAAPHEKGRGSDYDECTSPSECSLNGCVVDSHCVCDTGWVGSQCGVLDLAPATISSSYIPPDGVSSSWGMSVVKETLAATPTYHGYVSEFLFKCNLDSWGSNSYVNHVVSPTPTGPWTRAKSGPAVGVWAHNPRVQYEFWYRESLKDFAVHPNVKHCDGTGGGGGTGSGGVGSTVSHSSASPFQIHVSKSVDGPWTPLPHNASSTPLPGKMMTAYQGWSNVDEGAAPHAPEGGVVLKEDPTKGNGSLYLDFKSHFTPNDHRNGALAWDACGAGVDAGPAVYDNGHPVEAAGGSTVYSVEVTTKPAGGGSSGSSGGSGASATILAGEPCDLSYEYAKVDVSNPITSASGAVKVASIGNGVKSVNYIE